MKLNDIIAMCNAGFSAQQIASMVELESMQPVQQIPNTQQQIQQPALQTVQQIPNTQQQIQQPVQQIQQPALQIPNTQQQFNEILAAIRGSNLSAAEQPQQQTSDQILASIINPPTKEV